MAPEIRALGDGLIPLDGEWAEPFRLVFTITGAAADMSLDLDTITKDSFSAEPAEVTFGDTGGSR